MYKYLLSTCPHKPEAPILEIPLYFPPDLHPLLYRFLHRLSHLLLLLFFSSSCLPWLQPLLPPCSTLPHLVSHALLDRRSEYTQLLTDHLLDLHQRRRRCGRRSRPSLRRRRRDARRSRPPRHIRLVPWRVPLRPQITALMEALCVITIICNGICASCNSMGHLLVFALLTPVIHPTVVAHCHCSLR